MPFSPHGAWKTLFFAALGGLHLDKSFLFVFGLHHTKHSLPKCIGLCSGRRLISERVLSMLGVVPRHHMSTLEKLLDKCSLVLPSFWRRKNNAFCRCLQTSIFTTYYWLKIFGWKDFPFSLKGYQALVEVYFVFRAFFPTWQRVGLVPLAPLIEF